ncbi:hypothetical protein, conserved [Trypanosoma brucei brucei TREU927]|uniref:Uncharacterized protein n=1 Tax=Trypanosoma brucei brucei (strain 927/4 GUTat10.1) TaxID=185431 RepID=Q382L0_TRYB2|nr:hypothetical protein, conserved [Trypanosoma brucei brucei TREU927]EAN80271.1 hypothetical protein, conserved [Trypanosoma brucei brucei TREU927]
MHPYLFICKEGNNNNGSTTNLKSGMSLSDRRHTPLGRNLSESTELSQSLSSRSGGSSPIPRPNLDDITRRLLEENEGMLFEINKLTRELTDERAKVSGLHETLAERSAELELMKEKLSDATVVATDDTGKPINYKRECDGLAADNNRLVKEYERVCTELEKRTEEIRREMGDQRDEAEGKTISVQVEQFNREITALVPTVEHIVNSLKRCVVTGGIAEERILENAQKELHTMRRITDTVRRMNAGDETCVKGLLTQIQKGEQLTAPGDVAVVIRWMVVRAFEAGLQSAEGNLRTLVDILNNSKGRYTSENATTGSGEVPASGISVRQMFRLLKM